MFFKKVLSILMVLLLVLGLSACGKKGENNNSSETEVAVSKTESIKAETIENDITDPENTDLRPEGGKTVKAEELTRPRGKANGIDVSKWQGKINWQSVKKSGIDFAIIRIGFRGENGKIYKDSHADYNIQQAIRAGVLVGVYFFSTACNTAEAEEEAKWTVSAIEGYSVSYPVIYNCEGFNNADSRMKDLTVTERSNNAIAFLSYVQKAGYEGMFYAAKSELENDRDWETSRIEKLYSIWVAHYSGTPYPQAQNPDYSGKYAMWQFTDKGTVSGVSGNVDMVVSYFTREKAKAKNEAAKPQEAAAPKQDDKIYTAVSEEVTAKDTVNLRDAATTKSNVVGELKNGTFIKRIAVGSNGWSKLEFNGKTVYAITSYLTTEKGYTPPQTSSSASDGFTPATGEYTAKEETNLRAEPNTGSRIIATIRNGEFATRIGVSNSGWTKLSYKGQTVYAVSSFLTTEIKKTEPSSSAESSVDSEFTPASGRVTAKSETNLRTAPSTDGTDVVHLLKRGEFAELVGKSAKGWAKLSFNGQTVYAIASYLMTEEEFNSATQNIE